MYSTGWTGKATVWVSLVFVLFIMIHKTIQMAISQPFTANIINTEVSVATVNFIMNLYLIRYGFKVFPLHDKWCVLFVSGR